MDSAAIPTPSQPYHPAGNQAQIKPIATEY